MLIFSIIPRYFCNIILTYICIIHFVVVFSGIEISDVLKIDDKDYSITFSLYFNVQWSEPRLNLSQEFFNSENITGDEQLVPGMYYNYLLMCICMSRQVIMYN